MDRSSRRSNAAAELAQSGTAFHHPLLDERRPPERSKRRSRMSRMFPFWRHCVRFAPLVRVYHETTWSEQDYRNARRGPWIYLAADRHRFQKRINEFDSNFGYIFSDEHRFDIVSRFELLSPN